MEQTADRQGIRDRLEQLVAKTSQSEVARRTGVSVVSVNRYLKGTRVPSDFCAALVRTFGVNPSWLLTGEGTAYLADITAGTVTMAGDVLELVEAMNAVARMRLGALAGKHHLRVLRELNDALTRYEELRLRMNKQSAPIFRQILGDFDKALQAFQLDRAGDLRKAAEQVARLCDDPDLHRSLRILLAHDEVLHGNEAKALQYQRAILMEATARAELIDVDTCRQIYRMVLTLDTLGKQPAALRVCDAVLALASSDPSEIPELASIAFLRGRLLAKLGKLSEGLGIMTRFMPRTPPRLGMAMRLWMVPQLLRAGVLRPEDASEYGEHITPKALAIVSHAGMMEDPEMLRMALEYFEDKRHMPLGDLRPPAVYERLLLRAMNDQDRSVLKELADVVANVYRENRDAPTVYRVQLMRALGMEKEARANLLKADDEIASFSEETPPEFSMLAIHHRNTLMLATSRDRGRRADMAKSALTFFRQSVQDGFICFSEWLRETPGPQSA